MDDSRVITNENDSFNETGSNNTEPSSTSSTERRKFLKKSEQNTKKIIASRTEYYKKCLFIQTRKHTTRITRKVLKNFLKKISVRVPIQICADRILRLNYWDPNCINKKIKYEELLADNEINQIKMDLFASRRILRDQLCVKISQISKYLQVLKDTKGSKFLEEKLIAERLLLVSEVNYNIVVTKIRDDTNEELTVQQTPIGKITISNIAIPVIDNKKLLLDSKEEYFVVLLSCGTSVKATGLTTSEDGKLRVEENFEFQVPVGFQIKIQIFSVFGEKTKSDYITKLLYKIQPTLAPNSPPITTTTIYYNNLITNELESKQVLKTSFELRGEYTIQGKTIYNGPQQRHLIKIPSPASTLTDKINLRTTLTDFHIPTERYGFLTFGLKISEAFFWEYCWCKLSGSKLKIFRYPNDEYYDKSLIDIDLKLCINKNIDNVEQSPYCLGTRTFVLEIISKSLNLNRRNLKSTVKSSMTIICFYFKANSVQDYKNWVYDINYVLDAYHSWDLEVKNTCFIE